MKYTAAVFPFSEQALPIVRHMDDFDVPYIVHRLIGFKGDGLDKKDAAYICNQPPIGITVTDCFASVGENWQVLIIDTEALEKRNMQNKCNAIWEDCLRRGKQLVFVGSNRQSLQSKYSGFCVAYPNAIKFITSDGDATCENYIYTSYSPVPVPVILVGGMVKQCDTLEILCELQRCFRKDGRMASCVCESSLGLLLGMHSYNHIFKDCCTTEAEKITQINELVNNIVHVERPECVIIEAPDSVIKYSNLVPNGFCVRTYMVREAVTPGLFIYSLPESFSNEELIERMSDGFQKKYGFAISAVHVNNILIDSYATAQSENVSFIYTDVTISHLKQYSEKRKIPVFNVVENGGEALYQHISSLLI